MKKLFLNILTALLIAFHATALAATQQSNFNILPSPIAYPYFAPDRLDGKIDGSLVNITAPSITMTGGFADLKGRYAFMEYFAIDGEFGMGGLAGTMPGIAPLALTYASNGVPYTYRIDGEGQISMFAFRMSANLEIQAFHNDFFGVILFGGPNFSGTNMTITTQYSLIVPHGYTNAGQVFSGYTDNLTIGSSMSGGQFGIQLDLYSKDLGIRISPFFITSTFSGTATLTDNPGDSRTSSTVLSAQIPSTTSTSFGMDIIFNNISIGTVLQQLSSQQQNNSDVNIFMLSFGYRFSNEENQLNSNDQTKK